MFVLLVGDYMKLLLQRHSACSLYHSFASEEEKNGIPVAETVLIMCASQHRN